MEIQYISHEHRMFFQEMLAQCRRNDVYHQSLFYLLGLSAETRAHISELFDFADDCINPDSLAAGWQTGGTTRICQFAFNLWNDFCGDVSGDGQASDMAAYTPGNLFCCEFARYFCEAVKIRFPEYF